MLVDTVSSGEVGWRPLIFEHRVVCTVIIVFRIINYNILRYKKMVANKTNIVHTSVFILDKEFLGKSSKNHIFFEKIPHMVWVGKLFKWEKSKTILFYKKCYETKSLNGKVILKGESQKHYYYYRENFPREKIRWSI